MAFEAFLAILFGAISYNLTGFGKSPGEKFDWVKFLIAIVVGAIVGTVAYFQGWELGFAFDWATGFGLVGFIENIVKTVIRRWPK